MSSINIKGRSLPASLWLFVFVFVFTAQAIDALLFYNHLQHLTNWAWVFHGLVAAIRAFSGTAPRILTLLAFGISLFVAAGMISIQAMDNSMIEMFEKEHGVAMVTFANFVFHYLPPLFWSAVLAWERDSTHEWYKNTPYFSALTQTNVVTLMLLSVYSVLFKIQEEYPGANINFYILFMAGATAIIVGFAFVLIPDSF